MAVMSRTSTLTGFDAPETLELPLLEDAQELDLRRGGKVADLVEEESAAVRELEPALLLPVRRR